MDLQLQRFDLSIHNMQEISKIPFLSYFRINILLSNGKYFLPFDIE